MRAAPEPNIEPLRSSTGPHVENLNDLDDQAGLFAYLAFDGLRRRFVRLQEAARESPWRERSIGVAEQEDAPVLIEDYPEDAHEEGRTRDPHEESLDPRRKAAGKCVGGALHTPDQQRRAA